MFPGYIEAHLRHSGSETRRGVLADLLSTACRLGDAELEVLALLADRLVVGAERYGALRVDDGRDWEREALEEVLDAQIYSAVVLLRERPDGGSQGKASDRSEGAAARATLREADSTQANPRAEGANPAQGNLVHRTTRGNGGR